MNKQEFLEKLRAGLSGLPQEDAQERINFYSEMIDDRVDEGMTQEQAIAEIGNADEIISQIIADIPLAKLVKQKINPNRGLKFWEVLCIALGAPIWLSLLISAFSVIISLYAAVWCVIISLWAVFAFLVGCAFAGVVSGVVIALGGKALSGVAMIGAGIVCAGLCIFAFFGCKATTKGTALLTKKIIFSIKNCFVKKEESK